MNNQRKKNRRYYTEKWEEENLYQECRNCRHKYSTLECELCVDFDMYEEDTKCVCGYEFSRDLGDGYHDIPIERKTKYCPDCGQKLQWDE